MKNARIGWKGRPCTVHLQFFNPDTCRPSATPTSSTAGSWTASSTKRPTPTPGPRSSPPRPSSARRGLPPFGSLTDRDQQRRHPGDTGLFKVPAMQNRRPREPCAPREMTDLGRLPPPRRRRALRMGLGRLRPLHVGLGAGAPRRRSSRLSARALPLPSRRARPHPPARRYGSDGTAPGARRRLSITADPQPGDIGLVRDPVAGPLFAIRTALGWAAKGPTGIALGAFPVIVAWGV